MFSTNPFAVNHFVTELEKDQRRDESIIFLIVVEELLIMEEEGKAADNELNREFRAEKPNQKWVTDVTEFRLFGQKPYLSPILGLCSGDVVTYTLSESPNLLMVTTMLEQAFEKIPDNTGLLLHSDQGWHYQHKQYRRMLERKGIKTGKGFTARKCNTAVYGMSA